MFSGSYYFPRAALTKPQTQGSDHTHPSQSAGSKLQTEVLRGHAAAGGTSCLSQSLVVPAILGVSWSTQSLPVGSRGISFLVRTLSCWGGTRRLQVTDPLTDHTGNGPISREAPF